MKNCIFLLVFLVLLFNCKKEVAQNKSVDSVKKPALSIVKKHANSNTLKSFSAAQITQWTEFAALQSFITRFKNISPNEALSNSLELKGLVKNAKDSLSLEILKTPAFRTRLNVFENEVLRLADMTYIPSISASEVNSQVAKILSVYESVNEKINTVFIKKRFEESLHKDDIFNPLDSITTSSLNKKNEKTPQLKSVKKRIK